MSGDDSFATGGTSVSSGDSGSPAPNSAVEPSKPLVAENARKSVPKARQSPHRCYSTRKTFVEREAKLLGIMRDSECPQSRTFKDVAIKLQTSGLYSLKTTVADIESTLQRIYERSRRRKPKAQ